MRAARLHGPGDLRVDMIEAPAAGAGEVIVRVAACGICGSDLGYVDAGGVAAPVAEPIGLGHELAGVIAEVGAGVAGLAPGMRVVVNPMGDGNAIGNGMAEGGFAPLLRVRGATLGGSILPVPNDLPLDRAALAEPLAVALHAVARSGARPGDKVAVFGAGPIGLGIIHGLRAAGVTDIVAIDLSPVRLDRARRLGATVAINAGTQDVRAALAAQHGEASLFGWPVVGTSLFFDVSGSAQVIADAIALAPFHARIVVVAVHRAPVTLDFQMALGKELTITTSMAYPNEFPAALAMLAADPGLGTLISHRFAFADFGDAFAMARRAHEAVKVMVLFDAD